MAEYLEYDCEFDDIQEQDKPEKEMIYIRKSIIDDVEWWIVSEYGGWNLGRFWEIEMARIFAEAL